MKTALSRLPSSLEDMRLLSLGPELQRWSRDFEPSGLAALTEALEACRSGIASVTAQQEEFTRSRNLLGELSDSEKAEETRLAILLSTHTRTLCSLMDQHGKALALSNALILHSFTRGNLLDRMNATLDPATPRRRMGSGAGQVMDVDV